MSGAVVQGIKIGAPHMPRHFATPLFVLCRNAMFIEHFLVRQALRKNKHIRADILLQADDNMLR